ncbi:MAG: abortive infection family protein [Candidatus Zixiibacteriota bacterium]
MKISESTRRDIMDALSVEKVLWSGRLEEPEFLGRLFDLKSMCSYDGRFSNAYGDIWQHRVNNYDWDDDWVFRDSRFNLLRADDEVFLRFLCEMLHPVVRADPEEVERLKQLFNEYLRKDGYKLVERTQMSGRPVFAARLISAPGAGILDTARDTLRGIDASYVLQQITRMETAVDEDPGLAIGTAKELVETCCKTILREHGAGAENKSDLPQLVKSTARVLALTPDDIPEKAKAADTIRRLLSNLAAITQGCAELRNYYGTGHGKEAGVKGLQPRHAKLAVGAASTLAVFLFRHTKREVNQDSTLPCIACPPPHLGERKVRPCAQNALPSLLFPPTCGEPACSERSRTVEPFRHRRTSPPEAHKKGREGFP